MADLDAVTDTISETLKKSFIGGRDHLNRIGLWEIFINADGSPEISPHVNNLVITARIEPAGQQSMAVRGNYYSRIEQRALKNQIQVIIVSPTEITESDIPALWDDVSEVVRHELQHGVQEKEGRMPTLESLFEMYKIKTTKDGLLDYSDPASVVAYNLLPTEIEAFVAGARYRAKKKGIPFAEAYQYQLRRIRDRLLYNKVSEGSADKAVKEIWMRYATMGAITSAADVEAQIDALYKSFDNLMAQRNAYTPKELIVALNNGNNAAFKIISDAKAAGIGIPAQSYTRILTLLSISSDGAYYLWYALEPKYQRIMQNRINELIKNANFQTLFWKIREAVGSLSEPVLRYIDSFRSEFFILFGILNPNEPIGQQLSRFKPTREYTARVNYLEKIIPYRREPLPYKLVRQILDTEGGFVVHHEPEPLVPKNKPTVPFASRVTPYGRGVHGLLTDAQAMDIDKTLYMVDRAVASAPNFDKSMRAYEVGNYLMLSADRVDAGVRDPEQFYKDVTNAQALLAAFDKNDLKMGLIAAAAMAGIWGLAYYLVKKTSGA